ncbi:MAG: FtsX-like permease family protein [Phycisphaerae bacterium]|nr:FtsX-like permease family protein [Phycisphaerae bacterium]NIP50774.1 FtsX-like permease family protein [Phycisphaerae bacterium]NIS49938.1 FtsX-like permease family protein [Phycisphaerae bacterium]NIU07642.1 FtsX-like permease family protein [Phycisphaerae bacterium]NIU57424.1 FtsX-like permease family protein [Phycisphaerae bacterium]
MNLLGLVKKGLVFYWRTNLGVLLAVMTSTAILTGALVVGDSVRHSLRMMMKARLGKTNLALVANNRFFTAGLADELAKKLNTNVAPVLYLQGIVANSDGTKRANKIEVLGLDGRFFALGPGNNPSGEDFSEGIVLNDSLAARLGVTVGDEVVLRIEQPALMSRDIPITPDSDLSIASRLIVKAVAGESEFGRFSLQANQIPSLNAYVPIEWLQKQLDRTGQANVLLVADNANDSLTVERANEAVRKSWQLADSGLELREMEKRGVLELRSRRIFIDESLTEAATNAREGAVGILTYFVNELRSGDRTTPYSMVTAMGKSQSPHSIIDMDMPDDEIIINQWLADDLGVDAGDSLELSYFVVSPMRKHDQETTSFKIRRILPMEGLAIDPDLMPNFPGLADADNCRDWDQGIPIDLDKIRKSDEDYWDKFQGTPKAFITLKAGQSMWANRYGNLTAVRYPLADKSGNEVKENINAKILKSVDPASVGLYFQPVRKRGIKAGNQATDFGQLFLGFSFFLIIAALMLMSLIFVFGVENRTEQVGMLLAVGFPPKLVRRLLFVEGGILALFGAIAGTAVGLLYTKAMIYGLATLWRVAVSGSSIQFHAKSSTLLLGALIAVAVSLIAIWLTLRKQVSRPARELLVGELKWQFFAAGPLSKRRIGLWIAALATVSAAVLLVFMSTGEGGAAAGAFFGAGALLLIAGLGIIRFFLRILTDSWSKPLTSLAGLGLRNSTRRSGRSLAVAGLLACGIFLVIAVGANRHDPLADAHKRDSGTGGFAIFGESSIAVLHDLNSKAGRKSLGLDVGELEDIKVVQLRFHKGDDASCFNLNRAQTPSLLGLQAEKIQNAFWFTDTIEDFPKEKAWQLLNRNLGEDVVPAIGDNATIVWAIGKSVGDDIEYTDEKGRTFRLRIVGMLKNSILQGNLIIAEDKLVERFPSEDGYKIFLADVDAEKADKVMEILTAGLTDYGLALTPAAQRLAEFSAVENTYLSIFQLLGGLGLILGSLGLGLVVLRNVLDRRGELAMMRAVGLNKVELKRMVFYEHGGLMLAGLACGVIAALVAVGPALSSAAAQVPFLSLALTIIAIGISGLAAIWVATSFALSGKLIEALRSE